MFNLVLGTCVLLAISTIGGLFVAVGLALWRRLNDNRTRSK